MTVMYGSVDMYGMWYLGNALSFVFTTFNFCFRCLCFQRKELRVIATHHTMFFPHYMIFGIKTLMIVLFRILFDVMTTVTKWF